MSAEPNLPFECFARLRGSGPEHAHWGGALSADTLATYRSVWNLWGQWLAGEGVRWDCATVADMHRFLLTPQPRAHGGLKTSEVTKRRYWRILRDVYQIALFGEEGAENRFANPWDVGARHLEMSAHSVFLGAPEMDRLRQRLADTLAHAEAAAAAGCAVAWTHWRDIALVAVLLSTACKVSEMRLLREEHFFSHAPHGSRPGGPMRYVKLESHRAGGTRQRKLELDPTAQRALTAWLACRSTSGLIRETPLFVSAASRTAIGAKALSAKSIFLVVSQFVSETLPERSLLHVGPETIRNSVIFQWIREGVEETKILEDAGVQDSKILRRLERASAQHQEASVPAAKRTRR